MTITTQPPPQTKRRSKTKADRPPAPTGRPALPQRSAAEVEPFEPGATALSPDDWPDMSHIVTEDDIPVDNIFSEKQQRLLTEPLYTSWAGPGADRPFVALANVGLFFGIDLPPLVPDVMLSLDVRIPDEVFTKLHRSYFIWVYGKPPEVVIEVVSNREGGEGDRKLEKYARLGIAYYVIFDPERHLGSKVLRIYRLSGGVYRPAANGIMPTVGLGLRLWEGEYEGMTATWLRWYDEDGRLIPTGAERADSESQRADEERLRSERLAAQLRALGVEPGD
jgi:Uma2 family endonuclease